MLISFQITLPRGFGIDSKRPIDSMFWGISTLENINIGDFVDFVEIDIRKIEKPKAAI